jgi:ABC-type multidrug transport system fused ATPase/permease subunit
MTARSKFLARLDEYYRPFYKVVCVIFVLTTATSLIDLVAPYLFGRIVDLLAKGETFATVLLYAIGALTAYLVSVLVATWNEHYQNRNFDFDLPRSIMKKAIEKIFAFSIGQLANENSAIKLSVITSGESALRNSFNIIVVSLGPTLLRALLTVIALTIADPILGGLLFVGVSLETIVSIALSKRFYPEIKANQESRRDDEKRASEALRNAILIKANAREVETVRELDERRSRLDERFKEMWDRFIVKATARMFVSEFFRFAVILLGAWLVVIGKHTPGELVIYLSWSSSAFNGFGRIGFQFRSLLSDYERISRYFAMLDIPPAVTISPRAVALRPLGGTITFESVSFAYPGRDNPEVEGAHTLHEVSFPIKKGETVAIVGHSGAGKSTIITLLLRGYDPKHGRVTVDGYDLAELDLRSYLEQVGYVEQQVELFDESLRSNILFGVPEANREEATLRLPEVLAASRIDQFLPRLGEKGIDTLIGERGVRLSGGERQRVGIARALIKDPRVLIFDEATSSLDSENEALIHEAIRDALKGRTGIIIAHRLSTVRDADKIIVMKEGRVLGIGKHRSLLTSVPEYRLLVERQLTKESDQPTKKKR